MIQVKQFPDILFCTYSSNMKKKKLAKGLGQWKNYEKFSPKKQSIKWQDKKNLCASQEKFHGFVPFHVTHKSDGRYTVWILYGTACVSITRRPQTLLCIWSKFCLSCHPCRVPSNLPRMIVSPFLESPSRPPAQDKAWDSRSVWEKGMMESWNVSVINHCQMYFYGGKNWSTTRL